MSLEQKEQSRADIHAENIGGITETQVTFSSGVTVLEGRNATNRTSLLQAIATAMGSDEVSLKGDADEGQVEIDLDGDTYSRKFIRRDGTIQSSGDPYLEDPTLADLFAFLFESNEARRAVARGDDLRDIIMRPIDTDEIQAEIDRLVQKRRNLDNEIEEIDSLKGKLPDLEEERTRLEDQIADKKEELAEKEQKLEEIDADLEETREAKSELEEKFDELREKRSALDNVRYDIDTEQERLDALASELSELESKQAELPEAPAGEINELDSEIDRLRTKKQNLQSGINELQSVIGFNEEMLEETNDEFFEALQDEDDGALTDQLVDDTAVTCWTCGSDVEREQIQRTVDQLRELNSERFQDVSDLEDRLGELKEERQTLEEQQRERDRTERRIANLEEDIESQEATIERLKEKREQFRADIEDLEETVDGLEGDARSDIVEVNKEANQLEYELGRLESDLERVEDEIAEIEERLNERDRLEEKRAGIKSELEDLRTKIDRIEQEAIEEFNDHMETVLDLLDYENLDRIWLERVEKEVREGRRKVTKSTFELHVIRSTDSGTTYEDTVDHLSESEREVTGLVFALAGYLVHDVYETVPFMLLDSLEAIDSNRIATIIEYLADYSEHLVVALLPEDARALDEDHERVTSI